MTDAAAAASRALYSLMLGWIVSVIVIVMLMKLRRLFSVVIPAGYISSGTI